FEAPASNGGSAVLDYTVTSWPGNFTSTITQSGSGVVFVSGLSNGVQYTFTVRARNAYGSSMPSLASDPVQIYLTTLSSEWDGSTASNFGPQELNAGESEANPIVISTPMQWMYAADLAVGDTLRSKKFALGANLDFQGLS